MGADDRRADDATAISLAAGARIAGYLLEERIGAGGMAVVFRARDERLDRPVALKVLAPALASADEFQQRFISESRAAAAIDAPHIVPVFAAGEADGLLFIAMRYVAGGDAGSMLDRAGPLPPDQVAALVSPVAAALDAAHRAGLVHRDVKPSNMLMDVLPGRPAHVYLSDFGLSKSVAATSSLTAAGTILGTLSYMSPEQLKSEPVDGQADQYALACSAFELLAGSPPFQRDDPAALMYAHLFEDPPQLTSSRPELPPAVDSALARALAKDPRDRYASCGEFADALRAVLGLHPYRPASRAVSAPALASAVTHPLTRAAATPTRPDDVTDPGHRHGGDSPQPRHRLRLRRITVAAGIVAAGVVAAALAVGLTLALGHPAAPVATVPIAVKSAFSPIGGDTYVVYGGANGKGSVEVSGKVSKASSGAVATLYAQRFPFREAPTKVGSVTLHPVGGTATYAFRVVPAVATRYRVEVFPGSTSSSPVALSPAKTVYVAIGQSSDDAQQCDGSVCSVTLEQVVSAPPSALKGEMTKKPYPYLGLALSKTKKALPDPTTLSLGAGHPMVLGVTQISTSRFRLAVSFSFTIGHDFDAVNVSACFKDTFAVDGVGLPGHHGCGDQRIPIPAAYLG
ncbi:MAG TPA: serine/threonine-protein kinase [Trebonia sp.]|nr:serine/threonine-protein kinase [Trebonia sp.]